MTHPCLFWDDVKTVMDSDTTKGEKVIAGASLVRENSGKSLETH